MQHFSYNNGKTEHTKGRIKPNKRVKNLFMAVVMTSMVALFASGCATTGVYGSGPNGRPTTQERQQENVMRQIFRSIGQATEGVVEQTVKEAIGTDSRTSRILGTGIGRAAGDAAGGSLMGIFGRDQYGRPIKDNQDNRRHTGRQYDLGGNQQGQVVQPENADSTQTDNRQSTGKRYKIR